MEIDTKEYDVIDDKKVLMILSAIILVSTLMDGLDASMVTIALPTMSEAFGVDASASSWMINAYTLGIAVPLLAFAKIADTGKIREIFVIGMAIFTCASVMCALSYAYFFLIISRVIQGIGAAMIGAVCPIMVIRLFPSDRKGRGMALMALATGLALVIGPSIGAVLLTLASWHMIFFINIPIGIITVILGMKVLQKKPKWERSFLPDIPSIFYMGLFIVTALVLLDSSFAKDFDMIYLVVGLAIIAFALIMLVRRLKMRDKIENHLMNIDLFKNREFILVGTSFLLTTMLAAGVQFILPYFMQYTWDLEKIVCGGLMIFLSIGSVCAAFYTGRWCDEKGCRTPTAIAIVLRIAFSAMFLLMVPAWGIWALILALLLMGLSFGISGTSQSTRMVHHAKKELQGEASAFMLEVNYVGAALGTVAYAMAFRLCYAPDITGAELAMEAMHLSSILGLILAAIALICTLSVRNIIPKNDLSE